MLKTEIRRELPFPERWRPEIRGQSAAHPLEPLAREHAEIEALLRRVEEAADGSSLGEELYEVIRAEVLAHGAAARAVVLPELGRDAAQALRARGDALVAAVGRLDALHPATREWKDAFGDLSGHARACFGELERALGDCCAPHHAVRLEGAFLRAKAHEVERLEPIDSETL